MLPRDRARKVAMEVVFGGSGLPPAAVHVKKCRVRFELCNLCYPQGGHKPLFPPELAYDVGMWEAAVCTTVVLCR